MHGEQWRLFGAQSSGGDDDGTDTQCTRGARQRRDQSKRRARCCRRCRRRGPIAGETRADTSVWLVMDRWSCLFWIRSTVPPPGTVPLRDTEDGWDGEDGHHHRRCHVFFEECGGLTGTRISEYCARARVVTLATGTTRSFDGSSSLQWWPTSSGSICSRSPQRTPR